LDVHPGTSGHFHAKNEGLYWSYPPISTIVAMNNHSIIPNLVVGRIGYGQVRFDQPVDLSNLCSIRDIPGKVIVFGRGTCTVYPDDSMKPPVGQGLNVAATVTMEKCWPVSEETGNHILDVSDPRFIKYIQQLKQRPDTEFLYYNSETGSWTFKVMHFSSYSTGEGWENFTFAPRHQSRAASSAPSTSSSSSSSSQTVQKRRETFESRFAPIWERFCTSTLTIQDKKFLETTMVNLDDYDHYSNVYKFRRGVELINSRIVLFEVPLRPHESVAETINHLVGRTYDLLPGGDICSLGSAGMLPPLKF
jgi:Nucleoporin autopeptidase